jgi:hypothetical protein
VYRAIGNELGRDVAVEGKGRETVGRQLRSDKKEKQAKPISGVADF